MMQPGITECLTRFEQLTGHIVGDVLLDEYVAGDCSRLSPEAPVPILRVDQARVRWTLGGAANTATSLGGRAFDEAVPMPFLTEVQPHVHVNGSEYGPDCIEAPSVKQFGGRVHVVSKVAGLSTSAVLARVQAIDPVATLQESRGIA